jgi:hypothetical protein
LIGSYQKQRKNCALLAWTQIHLGRPAPGTHRAEEAELNVHRQVTASQ